MCRVLNVSRSGFYVWLKRQVEPSERQQYRVALDARVAQAFAARKGRSSSPTLTHDLHDQGLSYNRKTVAASQRRQYLRAKAAKKFKATTDSKHDLPVAPNLLQQNFTAMTTTQKWVGDINVPQQAAREMRVRLLAIGLQEQVANHRKRLGSKAPVVSVAEKVSQDVR